MNKEMVSSLIFLLTGIYGSLFSLKLPLGYWRDPGPGMFPLCLSMILCLSGILWFTYGIRKEERANWIATAGKLTNPLKIVGVTAAFILSVESLGYLLTSSFYLFLLFFWISRYRLWIALGLSLVIGVGSWYFFAKILSVQLPKGFPSL